MGIEKVCHGMRGVKRWVEYKYNTTGGWWQLLDMACQIYIYIYFCGYLRTINHAVQVIKCYIDDFMIQIWSKMKGKAYKMTDAESIV
jgi:hypothetical protein